MKVTSGWEGHREINTAWYDPKLISLEALTQAVRDSGTLVGILDSSGP